MGRSLSALQCFVEPCGDLARTITSGCLDAEKMTPATVKSMTRDRIMGFESPVPKALEPQVLT